MPVKACMHGLTQNPVGVLAEKLSNFAPSSCCLSSGNGQRCSERFGSRKWSCNDHSLFSITQAKRCSYSCLHVPLFDLAFRHQGGDCANAASTGARTAPTTPTVSRTRRSCVHLCRRSCAQS